MTLGQQICRTLLEREVMAYRYLYYCRGTPAVDDATYDILEAELVKMGWTKTPGSDRIQDYTREQKAYAVFLLVAGDE